MSTPSQGRPRSERDAARRHLACAVALAGVLLLSGAGAGAQEQESQAAAVAAATPSSAPAAVRRGGSWAPVRAGDILRITVWRKPELSGDFTVSGDGTLRHPLYRELHVQGVSVPEVAERLRVFLTRFEVNPELVVEALIRVAVVGEVRQPNIYTLSPETSIVEAIALAGGMTERGRTDRVHVRRRGRELVMKLAGATSNSADQPVESGDRITVVARRDVLRQYVAPIASIAAAVVSIYNVTRR